MSEPNNLEVLVPISPQGETDPTNPPIDDIGWLAEALFTFPDDVLSRLRTQSPHAQISWSALPFRGATRRLVPTTPRFAAEAFTNNHDAMSVTRRSLGRAARVSVRLGALRFAPRVHADASLVFNTPDQSVVAAAAEGLDQVVASCAITLGPRRYNRKPVVQLMSDQAETIGFLKVGADALTSAMVTAEAAAIEQLHQPTTPPLVVPRLLWQSVWNGRSVACFSPVSVDGRSLVPADPARRVATAQAVVTAGGGPRDIEFRDWPLIKRLRDSAARGSHPDVARLLDLAEAIFGSHTVSLGQWHGDFSPWNMISTADATALIDWEFASSDMPVGADLLHHRVMVATHLDGEEAQRPLRALLRYGYNVPELHAMAVPSDQHRTHLLLYLFELIHRDIELQRADRSDTGFGTPARAIIEAILAEAGR